MGNECSLTPRCLSLRHEWPENWDENAAYDPEDVVEGHADFREVGEAITDRAGDAACDEMGSAGFFHGGTECEHAENHVENSPLDGAARFLDIEAAREDHEDRGDKRDRGNGQHVKRSEHNHAENSGDCERRFVPAKGALCR